MTKCSKLDVFSFSFNGALSLAVRHIPYLLSKMNCSNHLKFDNLKFDLPKSFTFYYYDFLQKPWLITYNSFILLTPYNQHPNASYVLLGMLSSQLRIMWCIMVKLFFVEPLKSFALGLPAESLCKKVVVHGPGRLVCSRGSFRSMCLHECKRGYMAQDILQTVYLCESDGLWYDLDKKVVNPTPVCLRIQKRTKRV